MIAARGFFTRDGKWAVENEGVGPNIDIENWPNDVVARHDPQLERAVAEANRRRQPGASDLSYMASLLFMGNGRLIAS